jgi:hypothetical protein
VLTPQLVFSTSSKSLQTYALTLRSLQLKRVSPRIGDLRDFVSLASSYAIHTSSTQQLPSAKEYCTPRIFSSQGASTTSIRTFTRISSAPAASGAFNNTHTARNPRITSGLGLGNGPSSSPIILENGVELPVTPTQGASRMDSTPRQRSLGRSKTGAIKFSPVESAPAKDICIYLGFNLISR